MKELFESIGKRIDGTDDKLLQKIGDELSIIAVIEKNFKYTPGARFILRNNHVALLMLNVIELANKYKINYNDLIEEISIGHQKNITNDYLSKVKSGEDKGGIVRIRCERDISNDNNGYLGYYFLFSTKEMQKNITVEDIKNLLEESSQLKWDYKQQCKCGNYIFTTKYKWSSMNNFEAMSKKTIEFFINMPYTPIPTKFIITKL